MILKITPPPQEFIQIRHQLKLHVADKAGKPVCGTRAGMFQNILPGCEIADLVCKRCSRINNKHKQNME